MSDTNNASEALKELHGAESGRDTVLCVDDDQMIRKTVARVVSRMVLPGLNTELANGYDEAIEKVSGEFKGRIALIITDTEMPPGKNGIELADALKGKTASPEILEDMKKVPIVMSSGNSDYADSYSEGGASMQALIDSGAAEVFLAKPFSIDKIREAVMTAINRVREDGAVQ